VDEPEPLPAPRDPPTNAEPPPVDRLVSEQKSEEKNTSTLTVPFTKPSTRLRDFWQSAKDSLERKEVLPASQSVHPIKTNLLQEKLRQEKTQEKFSSTNFSNVEVDENPDYSDPFSKPVSIGPPKTLREARLSPWWPQYRDAAQIEYDGHIKSKTWQLVEKSSIPPGKNILRGKWVFDDKRGEDGKILKFKARFVAMGFTQKEGIDFSETFAGVVVGKSFRIMLCILNEDPSFEMEHWDVRMAFTQAFLDEEIYMYQPELFESNEKTMVCKLLKSLYGLKQAARNWQQMLIGIFREVGFFSLKADPCVFFLKTGDAWCMCSTHVDDIFTLFNRPGKNLRNCLYDKISSYVEIENLGPVSWALKTTILRNRSAGVIKISQEQFIREFLAKKQHDGVLKSTRTKCEITPSLAGNELAIPADPTLDREDLGLKKEFQSCIGAFWWLAQISRPDIFFAVHKCSKLVNNPTPRLGLRIKRIIEYLASTPSLGIVFQRHDNPSLLSGFVDAAYASEENFSSRLGYFFLFRGNLVSWTSENTKRQMTSSTEVECRGLVQIAKENVWHRQFHDELNLFPVTGPTVVFEDNSASRTMSTELGTPHKRSKHFGIEWAYFKESVELGEITPIHVSTNEQPADMMTKNLNSKKFVYFRDMVMGGPLLQSSFD
jgi:hypothetical protein